MGVNIFNGAIRKLVFTALPLVALFAALNLAWKYDMFKLRTSVTGFTSHIKTAFSDARRIVGLNADQMLKSLLSLKMKSDGDFFYGLTLSIVKLSVLWQGLVDAWGDNTLSEENFQKLNALGLLPVMNSILDFKQHLVELWGGFKQGVKEALNPIIKVFDKLKDSIKNTGGVLDPLFNKMAKFFGLSNNIDSSQWENIGKVMGNLAVIIPVVLGIGKVISIIFSIGSAIVTVVKGATILWNILTVVFNLLSVAAIALAAVLGLPVWAVVAIVAAVAGVVAAILIFRNQIANFFVTLWQNITKIVTSLLAPFQGVFSLIGAIVKITVDIIVGIFTVAWDIIKGIVWVLSNVFQAVFGVIGSIVKMSIDIFVSIFRICFDVIRLIVYSLIAVFKPVFEFIWANIIKPVIEGITTGFKSAADFIRRIWTPIKEFFSGVWSSIKSGAESAFTAIGNILKPIIDSIKWLADKIGSIAKGVAGGFHSVVDNVGKMIGLDTGGYVRTTGIAVLHPNEVVVNDEVTQKLRVFLEGKSPVVPVTNSGGSHSSNDDNSVKFEAGAIQVTLAGKSTEEDADEFVEKVMRKIERKQQMKRIRNYQAAN
jgi:phage-related protein